LFDFSLLLLQPNVFVCAAPETESAAEGAAMAAVGAAKREGEEAYHCSAAPTTFNPTLFFLHHFSTSFRPPTNLQYFSFTPLHPAPVQRKE